MDEAWKMRGGSTHLKWHWNKQRGELRSVLAFCLNLIGLHDCYNTVSKSKVKKDTDSVILSQHEHMSYFSFFKKYSELNQALFHFDSTLNISLYERRWLEAIENLWIQQSF